MTVIGSRETEKRNIIEGKLSCRTFCTDRATRVWVWQGIVAKIY